MTRTLRAGLVLLALGAPLVAAGACGGGDEGVKGASSSKGFANPPPSSGAAPQPQAAAADAGADGAAAIPSNLPPLPPPRDLEESAFTESDRNRDPFRPFVSLFSNQEKGHAPLQRAVLADRYGIDELKLVGIVTRAPARALLTDPAGIGWVVHPGDFVGKAETVHTGGPGGEDLPVNWRVERIKPTEVLLMREDPSHPETRTARNLELHPDQASSSGSNPPPAPNR